MINLKHAFRTLFKTPFVTVIAVLSLALGIGANAAIFSLFDEILRRPLPVVQPERLVNLSAPGPNPGSQSCGQAGDCQGDVFSYPTFRDLERSPAAFTGIAAHVLFGANVAYQGQTLNGEGMQVSGSYFPVLGLRPALGRLLGPSDDETVGASFVTVLGYSFWATQFGSSPAVLNQTMIINGKSMTIVGVAPRGFDGTTLGAEPKVYVPISMRRVMEPAFNGFEDRRDYWAYLFARLKPGASIEQARVAINGVYHPIINEVEAPLQIGVSDQTMKLFRAKEIKVADGRRGQSMMHAEAKMPLVMLLAITAIVLLIACANIANLLLARGAGRSMEMAVRLSLGATRTRIVLQLLAESLLLSLMGGAASLVVARWTLGAMTTLVPAQLAGGLHFALNETAMLFAAGLSIGTGLLFGLFPALHSTRTDLVSTLRDGSGKHSGTRGAVRFRTSLVTLQIALSMALLISAGLFAKSLRNVSRVDLGLRIDHVLGFSIAPVLNGYEPARSKVLFGRVEEELAALPGVTGVTAAAVPLLASSNRCRDVSVEGFKRTPDTNANSCYNEVAPGYFSVLGVPLIAGREFTAADAEGRAKVAIVNEAFTKKFNLGRNAVGKRMSHGGDTLDIEIVGLAKDSKYSQVKKEDPPVYFLPYRQDPRIGSMYFYVRTPLEPEQMLRALPAVIKRLDPNLPVARLKTLSQQVRENVFLDRMISTLSVAFAALATLLAAVGLYGVLAYSVAQRTREIGVRMALGADGGRVRRMVLRQVGVMTLVGGAIGLAGALALGNAARSLLFELQGNDPAVVAMSAILLAAVAFGAGYIPAMRAAKVDPMSALRRE
jgi:predicted permease